MIAEQLPGPLVVRFVADNELYLVVWIQLLNILIKIRSASPEAGVLISITHHPWIDSGDIHGTAGFQRDPVTIITAVSSSEQASCAEARHR